MRTGIEPEDEEEDEDEDGDRAGEGGRGRGPSRRRRKRTTAGNESEMKYMADVLFRNSNPFKFRQSGIKLSVVTDDKYQ